MARPEPSKPAGVGVSGIEWQMAKALFIRALRNGGWAADIGVLSPIAFEDDAAEMLTAVATGRAESGPPLP